MTKHVTMVSLAIAIYLLALKLYVDVVSICHFDHTNKNSASSNDQAYHQSWTPPSQQQQQQQQHSSTTDSVSDALVSADADATRESDNVVEVATKQQHQQQETTATAATTKKVLCLDGEFFGQTFNRIIQMANALTLAEDIGATGGVGLGVPFSEWYQGFLDPRNDVLLYYSGPCIMTMEPYAMYTHYKFDMGKVMKYLRALVPKESYRSEAEAAFSTYSNNGQHPVTTVHRRHLEGTCVSNVESMAYTACPNPHVRDDMSSMDLIHMCNLQYNMIANESNGTKVVLLTDNQVPELDSTFPIISDHSFPVQVWLMTISDYHVGNPYSTVDAVVYRWRCARGTGHTMRPRACYQGV